MTYAGPRWYDDVQMPTDHILSLLIEERNKIDRAIGALQGTPRSAAPGKTETHAANAATTQDTAPIRKRPRWTAAMRRAASVRAKTAHAERMKKAGKKR
jgi:hypothetical protein